MPTIKGTERALEIRDASDSVTSGWASTPESFTTNEDPTVSWPATLTLVAGTPSTSEIISHPGPGMVMPTTAP